ncbi:MAG: topoisomerase [Acidobacteria bacterium]|nr:topoisomerase [Acidobacteriota bacterium]
MTRLERLQKNGLRRLGTPKRGFRYVTADGARVSRADRKRIDALRIPPAWTSVAINPSAGGAIQVVGMDAAGRWQYLYHENQIKRRERKKLERLLKFSEQLPHMRKIVARDLRKTDLGRERVMASILRILSTCFIRPGSHIYANENGSYGLATLRTRHVRVRGDLIEFNFRGKSGVEQHSELKDRQVAKIVRALLRAPGWEVFKYQNGDSQFVNVTRSHINNYIKEVMGGNFSAKDFRTWAGTFVCACALARVDPEMPDTRTGRKRRVVQAIKETAKVLGNTPAVCRSAYISPEVLESFERGKVMGTYFETVEQLVNHRGKQMHAAERALLRLLKGKA